MRPSTAGTAKFICALGITILALLAPPSASALSVDRAELHQYEDGPPIAANHVFLPGETVFFSCRFSGYQAATGPNEQRSVKLSWEVSATDPAGIPVARSASGEIAEPLSSQDKDWHPKFLYSFVVPAYAPSGDYKISVRAKDEIGKSDVVNETKLRVRGRDVEPSEVLTARNLRFLKTDQDGTGFSPAIYHPGEVLWARFEITGYKFGPNNRYAVDYGLAIQKETGEQVFAQPEAAKDTNESFYPQRFVPGAVSLNLDANVPEGNYMLVILMKDEIGNQMAESKGTFRIERAAAR